MKRVMLYTTDKKLVTAHRDYLPWMTLPSIKQVINSRDILMIDEVRKVENLPIERWNIDGVEFFVAFDPVIREIIENRVESRAIELSSRLRRQVEKKDIEIESLQSRTIWDMIKLKFKRKDK